MATYPVTITATDALSNVATKDVTFITRAFGFHPSLLAGYAFRTGDFSEVGNNGLLAPSNYRICRGSRVLAGKRYVECWVNGTGSGTDAFGVAEEGAASNTWLGSAAAHCGLYPSGGAVYRGGSVIATGSPTTPAARRLKLAFDADTRSLWIGFVGGGWIGGGNPAAGTTPTTVMPAGVYRAAVTLGGSAAWAHINGGDEAFVDAPPAGFSGY
jgi:hypothetical protein